MNENGNPMVMPVAPYYGGNNDGMFGGNGAWWIIILLAVLGWGNGFGGGFGGNGGGGFFNADMQRGFDQQAVVTGINGIQSAINGVQTSLCNGFAGVNQGVSNGFAQAEIAANARQMADMNQQFAMQSAFQNCCCENRLATCQTQNLVQNEGAATRSTIQAGVQSILDKMCQDKIDAKNEKIVELNNRINSLEANNYIQNALTAQTQYFLGLYPPTNTAATPATGT
jgi:hypothetical protein